MIFVNVLEIRNKYDSSSNQIRRSRGGEDNTGGNGTFTKYAPSQVSTYCNWFSNDYERRKVIIECSCLLFWLSINTYRYF